VGSAEESGIKSIVLDGGGFWDELVPALRVLTPVVKALRQFDGDNPVVGKV
jgi:hypothetical protein